MTLNIKLYLKQKLYGPLFNNHMVVDLARREMKIAVEYKAIILYCCCHHLIYEHLVTTLTYGKLKKQIRLRILLQNCLIGEREERTI